MKTRKQWINWRLVPVSGKVKPDKVPYSHETRKNINPHDSNNWLTYQEAKANSDHVGFVLTGKDGYFCVDVDDGLIDGEWSEHSLRILSWFPGAYVEVSHFGKGLHIFGFSHGEVPSHKKKRKFADGEVELYTDKRFIAFSEQGCSGDYNCDLTTHLCDFIKNVMSPEPETRGVSGESVTAGNENRGGGEWQKPDERWHGPTDDTELIEKMLSSRGSAISLLNGKASIQDLWNKNVSVLAENYPDPTDNDRPYDESSPDMALMVHLAFWTGKDLPRMIKLARMSSLGRPKWDSDKTYLSRTGGIACKRCKNVYDSKSINGAVESATGSRFLSVDDQRKLFKRCVYISESGCIFDHNYGVMSPTRFNAWIPGATFAITYDGKSKTKKAFDAFINSQAHDFPKVERACFRPKLKPGEIIDIQGISHVNTYIPVDIQYGNGSVGMFLFLLGVLFPKKQDYNVIINYMAACVQYPGVKFRWCPIVQGVQGNGKSLLAKCVAHAIGKKYVFYAQTNDIANKFNGWMENKLFIIVNEIFTTGRRDTIDTLKDMISEDEIAVQKKGEETVIIDNFANFFMTTNHKDAIGELKNERRYAVFFTPQQEKEHLIRDGLTEEFFKEFGDWLTNRNGYNDIAGFLKRFKIDPKLNPAKEALVAPKSSSRDEAIRLSRSIAHQEVQEAINEGRHGFIGGWVSSHWLAELLKSKKINVSSNKRGDLIRELGYIPIPWYSNGRSSKLISIDENVKPILYIKKDAKFGDPKTIDDYINAQMNNPL